MKAVSWGRTLFVIAAVAVGLGATFMFSSVFGQSSEKSDWVALARAAQFVNEATIKSAAADIDRLPGPQQKLARKLLGELGQAPQSAAGIKQAAAKVQAVLPQLVDPKNAAEGQDPAVAKVKRASLTVLHGLVFKAGQALRGKPVPQAAELVRAVSEAQGVLRDSLGVQLTEEAREGLGHELYLSAAREIDPSLPGPGSGAK